MVGPPATGKSTLSRRLEAQGYHRVNQDTLKSIQKCIASAKSHLVACNNLSENSKNEYIALHWKGVVIDNTNTDEGVRRLWINVARELGLPVIFRRAFYWLP
jgi:bifunctional polynucleotide phosphatase/kinase